MIIPTVNFYITCYHFEPFEVKMELPFPDYRHMGEDSEPQDWYLHIKGRKIPVSMVSITNLLKKYHTEIIIEETLEREIPGRLGVPLTFNLGGTDIHTLVRAVASENEFDPDRELISFEIFLDQWCQCRSLTLLDIFDETDFLAAQSQLQGELLTM